MQEEQSKHLQYEAPTAETGLLIICSAHFVGFLANLMDLNCTSQTPSRYF